MQIIVCGDAAGGLHHGSYEGGGGKKMAGKLNWPVMWRII